MNAQAMWKLFKKSSETDAYEAFFTKDMAASGLTFDESMPVVCEEFEVVYPKEASQ